jgi:hypothetical protein
VRLVNVHDTIFEIVRKWTCEERYRLLLESGVNHGSAIAAKVDSSLGFGKDVKPGHSKIFVFHFQNESSRINQDTDLFPTEELQETSLSEVSSILINRLVASLVSWFQQVTEDFRVRLY